jgi:hypothetical protein
MELPQRQELPLFRYFAAIKGLTVQLLSRGTRYVTHLVPHFANKEHWGAGGGGGGG